MSDLLPENPPAPENGYAVDPTMEMTAALWNLILSSIHARIAAREEIEANFEALIAEGTSAGLTMIQENIAPQLVALQDTIAASQDAIDEMLAGTAPNAAQLGDQLPAYYLDPANFSISATVKALMAAADAAAAREAIGVGDAIAAALAAFVDGAPEALDTLQELAVALGNDANFASTITNALAGKLDKTGGEVHGALNIVGESTQWLSTRIYSDANYPIFYFFRSRGSEAAKAPVQANDILGTINVTGYDGSTFASAANLEFLASSDFSTSRSTKARLLLRENGSTRIAQEWFADGRSKLTGPLELPGAPANALHAATKEYVDGLVNPPLSPEAGDVVILSLVPNETGIEAAGWHPAIVETKRGVLQAGASSSPPGPRVCTAAVAGTIRVKCEYRKWSGGAAHFRVYKNGVEVYATSTSSTAYIQAGVDVSVVPDDIVGVQFRGSGSNDFHYFRSLTVCAHSADCIGAVGFTHGA